MRPRGVLTRLRRFLSGLLRALSLGRDATVLRRVLARFRGHRGAVPMPVATLHPALPPLEEFLSMPDRQIDLARAALAFAAETEPHLDPAPYLAEIRRLAAVLDAELGREPPPWNTVLAANRLLFYREAYRMDRMDRRNRDIDNLLLPRVMERRRGYCVGLSTLYLSVVRRLDLPFYGVSLPRHFLVRYEGGGERINVETTRKGKHLPDEFYVVRYGLTPEHLEMGVYLDNLGEKELLVEWLLARGNFRYNRGDREAAWADFDRATALSPNFVAGYLSRGLFLLQGGDPERALAELRDALRVDAHNPDVHLGLGDAYFRQGDLRRALSHFTQAAELAPGRALPRTNLGRLYTRTGDHARAEAEQAAALELEPDSAVVWNNLGVLAHARGQLRRAERAFKRALKHDPDFGAALQNLYRLLLSAGREGAAARVLRRFKQSPRH